MNNNNTMNNKMNNTMRGIIALFTLAMAVVLITACGEEYDFEGGCGGSCEGSGESSPTEPLPDVFEPELVSPLIECTGQWLDRWSWADRYLPYESNCRPISIHREASMEFHYSELLQVCTRRIDDYFEGSVPSEEQYNYCMLGHVIPDPEHPRSDMCAQLIPAYETWYRSRANCSEPGYSEHIDEPRSGIRTAYEYWNGVAERFRIEFVG